MGWDLGVRARDMVRDKVPASLGVRPEVSRCELTLKATDFKRNPKHWLRCKHRQRTAKEMSAGVIVGEGSGVR